MPNEHPTPAPRTTSCTCGWSGPTTELVQKRQDRPYACPACGSYAPANPARHRPQPVEAPLERGQRELRMGNPELAAKVSAILAADVAAARHRWTVGQPGLAGYDRLAEYMALVVNDAPDVIRALMAIVMSLVDVAESRKAELAAVRAAAVEACDLAAEVIDEMALSDEDGSIGADRERVATIRARIGGGT